jgi:Ribbon-helix-helix protein, copG family.
MKIYRLSARVDQVTHRKLTERARLEVKDESEIIREALKLYLDARETAYDMVMRIGGAGIATGLPSDLSTNKKYLKGFGESDSSRSSGHRPARRPSRT